jgi:PTH1 family peptidyl-tRNA hydrolase
MEDDLQPRIKAIVGLGNPGRDLAATRHNLGFEVVDFLAGEARFVAGKGSFYRCDTQISSGDIVLLKPTTYMNRSGVAVAEFAELEGLRPEGLLVIADDFNLPLGRIRLRLSGSDGGHKGLASIIFHLASEDFPRIRMGIGPVPEGIPAEEFVLEPFAKSELDIAREMITRTAEAATMWLVEGYERAAAQFNPYGSKDRAIDNN